MVLQEGLELTGFPSVVLVVFCGGSWCLPFMKSIPEGQSCLSNVPSCVLWVQAQFQLPDVDNNAHLKGLW